MSILAQHRSELAELLDSLASPGKYTKHIESDLNTLVSMRHLHNCSLGHQMKSYRLAEWSALANRHLVTLLHTERRRDVGGQILVSLLISRILGNEVKVLAADNQRSVHLGGHDGSGEDATTDGHQSGEWALLV